MTTPIQVDLSGKTAIVTGATSGIGKEIARGLARLGANVVLAVRDADRGDQVRAELAAEARGTLTVITLDVADLASVRGFAAAFERRFERLHILVNNAGAWFSDRRESPDGLELTFATNVVGPALLTQLLEPRLRASAPSRIVNVVSGFASNYDPQDLMYTRRSFDGVKAYAQTKLALRMITWGQAARLAGTGVTANAVAPGFVKTEFNRNAHGFKAAMIGLSARLFAVTADKGADTPLWAAVAPALADVTGKYFVDRTEKDGRFRDPLGIADLERRVAQLIAYGAADRHAAVSAEHSQAYRESHAKERSTTPQEAV